MPLPLTSTRALALIPVLVLGLTALAVHRGANADEPAPAAARKVPEALNFANGLFRERRYELAAQEYERFLKDAKPGLDASDALFGLANARLFQGEYAKARARFEEFLRAGPDHPGAATARYRVGETAYMLGDLPAARQAFEAFTTEAPQHKHADTAWPYLGDVCLRMGDLPKARRAYERSLTDHPEGRLADRARFGLGRALFLQGETDGALKAFTTLAETGGKDWTDRAWMQIGQAQAASKRFDDAAKAFAKVEAVAASSPLIPEARLNRAEALLKLDRRDEAAPILKALAADGPRTIAASAAFSLGTAELEAGDATAALATLDDAARRFAKTSMIAALNFRSAEAALKLGRADDAQERFLRAAESDPNDPWADDALARASRLALERHDPEGAKKLSAAFIEKYPKSPLRGDVRLVAARSALTLGKPKEAITLLTASLADDQPSPSTAEHQRYYLGLAYRADGQAAKASELLDALEKTAAAPIAADAQFMVGQAHVESKRFAESIPPLEKYLAGKPDGDVADFARAHLVQAYLELGESDKAVNALSELAKRFPKSKALPPSRVRVAEASLTAKQFDRAAEQFQKAAEESADPVLKGRAQLGLGWALLDGGKPADAAHAFGAFLEAHPNDPLAPEACLARARSLEANDKAEEALATYAQASETYPKSDIAPLAAIARARYKMRLKRPAEAAQAYDEFFKSFPGYKPKDGAPGLDALLAELGWAEIDAGKTANADSTFARLLAEFPDSPFAADARFNLAESAHQAQKDDEVVKLLTPLVATGSKASPRLIPSALYRLGRTEAERKEWSEAAKTLDRLLNDFPDTPFRRESRLLRAEVALEAGDAAAAEALLAALSSEPSDPTDPPGFARAVKGRLVQSLLARKKWQDVVAAAGAFKTDAKPNDPLTSEVDYARGRALQQLARWDESRAAYQSVIDARKGGDLVARAQLMIGETYYHQKDYHEAIRQFLKVDILYDAPPWQAAALLETGKAYEQLAQWADAAETYERLRAKFPDDPVSKDAKTRLDEVKKKLAGADEDGSGRLGRLFPPLPACGARGLRVQGEGNGKNRRPLSLTLSPLRGTRGPDFLLLPDAVSTSSRSRIAS